MTEKTEKKESWAFPEKRGPDSITEVRDRALSSARIPRSGSAAYDLDGEEKVWIYFKADSCRTRDGECTKCKPIIYGKNERLDAHVFAQVKAKHVQKLKSFARRRGNVLMDFPKGFKPGK